MSDATSLPRRLAGPYLAWLFRVALGVIFIVASVDKIANPAAFAASVSHYRLVPLHAVNLIAICLPWIELCCGALLVLGLGVRANLLVVNGMLAAFIVAILSALHRHLDISCGCFSTDASAHSMTRWTLYWDIIWLGMGVHAIIFDRGLLSLTALRRPRQGEGR